MIRDGSIKLTFTYAAGRAGSKFLTALGEQKILGSKCGGCGSTQCPPKSFCPACSDGEIEYVEVGPGGTLLSWTELPGRAVFGLVQLDGADTPLLHRLVGDASPHRAGARVRARFANEPHASILDIEGFEPEEEAAS